MVTWCPTSALEIYEIFFHLCGRLKTKHMSLLVADCTWCLQVFPPKLSLVRDLQLLPTSFQLEELVYKVPTSLTCKKIKLQIGSINPFLFSN